jgi:hypothetical protein
MTQVSTDQVEWVFNNLGYLRQNQRVQEHLAGLGLDLHNRTVLELGAGVGHHTTFFLDRGCLVTSVEPRPENCAVYQSAMQRAGYVSLPQGRGPALVMRMVEDLEGVLSEPFDVVYNYGLLYHTTDPALVLDVSAKWCRDLLLLETVVSYGEEEAVNPAPEEGHAPSQAVSGMGCRPTRPWIFRRLRELFAHVYCPTTQPAHENFPTDWVARSGRGSATRAVFVASRRPLASPMLLDHLPDKQTVAP